MVIRTREKLIEVARQLFINKGVENTTMNDIAEASDKGRRTIYTYFKNKIEIYNAVVEQQSENIVNRLREVAESHESPIVKLEKYLYLRMSLFDDYLRNDRLNWLFHRDSKRANKVQKLTLEKENPIIKKLIVEGINGGYFDPEQAIRFLAVERVIALGADYSHLNSFDIYENMTREELRANVVKYLLQGLLLKN